MYQRRDIDVALRIRPLSAEEKNAGAKQVAYKMDDKMVVLMDPDETVDDVLRHHRTREKQFIFDHALGPDASQKDVYESTAKPLVEGVLQGYNGTVFAYGATGAGKTYTMVGTSARPGIMARALDDLFKTMQKTKEETEFDVKMSYLEIYNELIRDLLNTTSGYLDLREDSKGSVSVPGLTQLRASSSREMLENLVQGNRRRTTEATSINMTSSRSHAVLLVDVALTNPGENDKTFGKLILIDLAGSERLNMAKTNGQRLKEGSHINRSLLALGNVITTLTEKGTKFINYRDSKLTRLLKDSLGGNAITCMIGNISPASIHFEESRSTLMYADRAKNITNRVLRNTDENMAVVAAMKQGNFNAVITDLKKEVARLKLELESNKMSLVSPKVELIEMKPVANEVLTFPAIELSDKMIQTTKSVSSTPVPTAISDLKFKRLKEEILGVLSNQRGLRHRLMEANDQAYEVALNLSAKDTLLQAWMERKRNESGANGKGLFNDPNGDPARILNLREEVTTMDRTLHDLLDQKTDIEVQLYENDGKLRKLESEFMKFTNASDSHKDGAFFLKSLHELETDKLVLESDNLLKNRKMVRQEHAIKTFQKYTKICDKLIAEQHALLEGATYPPKVNTLYNSYQVVRSQAHIHLLPLSKQATSLGLKSWNRSYLERERSRHGDDLAKTMSYADLQRMKTDNDMSSDARDLSSPDIPTVTSSGNTFTVDDSVIRVRPDRSPSHNRERRARTPPGRLFENSPRPLLKPSAANDKILVARARNAQPKGAKRPSSKGLRGVRFNPGAVENRRRSLSDNRSRGRPTPNKPPRSSNVVVPKRRLRSPSTLTRSHYSIGEFTATPSKQRIPVI